MYSLNVRVYPDLLLFSVFRFITSAMLMESRIVSTVDTEPYLMNILEPATTRTTCIVEQRNQPDMLQPRLPMLLLPTLPPKRPTLPPLHRTPQPTTLSRILLMISNLSGLISNYLLFLFYLNSRINCRYCIS